MAFLGVGESAGLEGLGFLLAKAVCFCSTFGLFRG